MSPLALLQASDPRLMARVANGDDAALAALYQRHHRGLLSFTRHLTGEGSAAEDAVRDAFVRLRRDAEAGTPPDNVRAALFAYAREASAEPSGKGDQPALDGLPPLVRERPELRVLLRGMTALPVDARAALVMYELRQLRVDEIAVVLDRSPDEVRALVASAYASLAQVGQSSPTCEDVQLHLSTARGRALIPMRMRAHIRQCDDCSRFKAAVIAQRRQIALLLPVVPAAGMAEHVLGAGVAAHGETGGFSLIAARPRGSAVAAGAAGAVAVSAVALAVVGAPGGGDGDRRSGSDPGAQSAPAAAGATGGGAGAESPSSGAAKAAKKKGKKRQKPSPKPTPVAVVGPAPVPGSGPLVVPASAPVSVPDAAPTPVSESAPDREKASDERDDSNGPNEPKKPTKPNEPKPDVPKETDPPTDEQPVTEEPEVPDPGPPQAPTDTPPETPDLPDTPVEPPGTPGTPGPPTTPPGTPGTPGPPGGEPPGTPGTQGPPPVAGGQA